MGYREPDFAGEMTLLTMQHKWKGAAAIKTELDAITAALASDVTTHDTTMTAAALALRPGLVPGNPSIARTRFTNDVLLLINAAKGGNLSNASMIAAIDTYLGEAFKPGLTSVPHASANASPPIVGTVCSVTNGNWLGMGAGTYAYAWARNGTPIGGATSATYTLVSADTGGKSITCIVTATNATGSTAAPPSNAIVVP